MTNDSAAPGLPSPLQIFWGFQTFLAGASTIYLLVKQSHWVKLSISSGDESIGLLQFRKRVFQQHLLAVLWLLYILWSAIGAYCLESPLNGYFYDFFYWATSPEKRSTEYGPTLMAMVLYLGHLTRRLHESWSVSVFSRRQLLGPIELLRVYSFYIAAGLSIIAESPALEGVPSCASLDGFGPRHILVLPIFFFASRLHHDTHVAFAKLRRNRAGHIVTTDHKMPKGGWFESLSSPHYFAELLIYASIGLVLGTSNSTWWWLVTYVFTNQFYLAYNTHKYYEGKFENYPKDRRIIVGLFQPGIIITLIIRQHILTCTKQPFAQFMKLHLVEVIDTVVWTVVSLGFVLWYVGYLQTYTFPYDYTRPSCPIEVPYPWEFFSV